MSRAAGLCRRCGGPRRGRAARTAAPAGQCVRCNDDVCYPKHSDWLADENGFVCHKCIREGKKQ